MKTKTNLKAGKVENHNATLAAGLRVKTAVKAGDPAVPMALTVNHNENLALRVPMALSNHRNQNPNTGLRVQTAVRAGHFADGSV
jgi:hypothetical protein